jgi:hypothetical protein
VKYLLSARRFARRDAWCGALGLVLVLGMAGRAWSQDLPEGKGKEVVEQQCTVCHGTSNFTSSRFSRQDWEYVVNEMIDRGALISDEDKTIIVNYLTEHFGPEEKPPEEKPKEKPKGDSASGN